MKLTPITVMDIPKVATAGAWQICFLCHENSEKASAEDCYYART